MHPSIDKEIWLGFTFQMVRLSSRSSNLSTQLAAYRRSSWTALQTPFECLGIQVDPAVRTEGASDTNPIQLPPSLNQDDFDHLLCYIYMGPTMHPKTDDFLVSILKLSTFFEITDGIAHAIHEFTKKGDDFHPALQFELARLYRVDDWIESAFRRLMKMPITCLNMFCAEQIGPPGYFCLVQTKAHIEHFRKQFTFDNPRSSMIPAARRWLLVALHGLASG
ncbi:hypothetical protein B0H19DRAFT_1072805 [Mycena capillaripes]|nr:hypothetical protein B0H19DRAFT_1072805 [Mycena capillaripes]